MIVALPSLGWGNVHCIPIFSWLNRVKSKFTEVILVILSCRHCDLALLAFLCRWSCSSLWYLVAGGRMVGMVGMVVGALILAISEWLFHQQSWLFHHEKMRFSGVKTFFFVGEPEYSDILLKRLQIPALRWFHWSGILDVGMQRTPPGFRVSAEFWFVLDQLTFHVFGLVFCMRSATRKAMAWTSAVSRQVFVVASISPVFVEQALLEAELWHLCQFMQSPCFCWFNRGELRFLISRG